LTYLERQKSYGLDKLRWEEVEEKIRLKQYVSLRSKGRHNNGSYYIDRCELWGFIREINSDISHVKYQFFPTGTTFTQL
jgi:hypothetical protein